MSVVVADGFEAVALAPSVLLFSLVLLSSLLFPSCRDSLVKMSWAVLVNVVEWVLCRGNGCLRGMHGQGEWLRLCWAVLLCVQGV